MPQPDLNDKIHSVLSAVESLTKVIEDRANNGQTQTVIHKSSMGGFIAGLAVAACIGSFFFAMYASRTLQNEMRDITAWQAVYGRDLAAVKQFVQQQKEKGQ